MTLGESQDLSFDEIDALLQRAEQRLKDAQQLTKTAKSLQIPTLPKLHAGEIPKSYVHSEHGITRTDARSTISESQRKLSEQPRKIEDPVAVKERKKKKRTCYSYILRQQIYGKDDSNPNFPLTQFSVPSWRRAAQMRDLNIIIIVTLSALFCCLISSIFAWERVVANKIAAAATLESWYNLPRTDLTPELKRDLQLLNMRSVLDPKRMYKKQGKLKIPEYSQVGTVIEGSTEFFSARIDRKDRKRTFVEEVLAAEQESGKFKSKYEELQVRKKSGKKGFYKALKQKRKGFGKS